MPGSQNLLLFSSHPLSYNEMFSEMDQETFANLGVKQLVFQWTILVAEHYTFFSSLIVDPEALL